MSQLIYGLVTGILFGFFLQRGQVLRYDKQIGALRLMDMTILKFMLTAIFVGSVGIYLLNDLGLAKLSIKTTLLGATIIGGLIFGLGWGLLGILPGDIHGRRWRGSLGWPLGGPGNAGGCCDLCRGLSFDETNHFDLGGSGQDHPTGDTGDKSLDCCSRFRACRCRTLLLVRKKETLENAHNPCERHEPELDRKVVLLQPRNSAATSKLIAEIY